MTLDLMLDYVRLVSYSIIILSSLRGILVRKFSRMLFIGDIVLAVGLFTTIFANDFLNFNLKLSADLFITPAAVIWAIIHWYEMMKFNNNGGKHDVR